jgi:hypothetical protein
MRLSALNMNGAVMKICLIGALAAGLALSSFGVSAYAQPVETTAQFRTVPSQGFSAEELQLYGLDADAAAEGEALQAQGYRILTLTPEEAEAYRAGELSQTQWILIGVGVLVILAVL